jgi:large subunit ribosomal protein LP2
VCLSAKAKLTINYENTMSVKHQAAYSLLYLSGNNTPSQSDVEKLMKECGVSVDKDAIKQFFKNMEGKVVADTIKEGQKKLITMPSVGGGGARSAGPAATAAPVEEEKKEEVEDVDMGGLFGGDDEY